MPHASRLTLGVLLSAMLVLGGAVAPVQALTRPGVEAAAMETPVTLQATGTIIVFSGESGPDAIVPRPDEIRLVAADGTSVELTGNLPADVATGSTFDGTLAVPEAVAAAVPDVAAEAAADAAPIDAGSDTGRLILGASTLLSEPLPVVTATIAPPELSATVAATAQVLDVAVVSLPTDPAGSGPTNAAVSTLTQQESAYWKSQSAGKISSLTQPLATVRFTDAAACDPYTMFTTAAAKFGRTTDDYWGGVTPRHLVVLVSAACGQGTGLGSIGTLTAGGVSWNVADSMFMRGTVTHELGHNFGLRHSNAHACPYPVTEGTTQSGGTFSNGCQDHAYEDFYDPMGGGIGYNGRTNAQPTALNITQKYRLDAITGTDLPAVKLPTGVASSSTSYSLNPVSNSTGLRGLRITDPRNGEIYFVEYRSGTGMDAGSVYSTSTLPGYAPGVRVLRIRDDNTSAALSLPHADGTISMALTASKSITSRSGGLTVQVTSLGGTAAVKVLLATQPTSTPKPTVPAVTRVAGPDRYATAAAVSKTGFPVSAPVVYLASGENFPDALAAGPAAAKQGGPLLLTLPRVAPRRHPGGDPAVEAEDDRRHRRSDVDLRRRLHQAEGHPAEHHPGVGPRPLRHGQSDRQLRVPHHVRVRLGGHGGGIRRCGLRLRCGSRRRNPRGSRQRG